MAWTEKLPSGRYSGVYRLPTGEKRRTDQTYTHKTPAKNAAATLEAEAAKPTWRDPRAALKPWGEWKATWLAGRIVDDSTKRRDGSRLNKHLVPKWDTVPLADITRHEVRKWAVELREKQLAPSTVQRIMSLFSSSMQAAVDAEIILANPAQRLKLPSPDNAVERFLTRKEAKKLLEQFGKGSIDRALVSLLIGSGLRWGEAIGLQRDRVKFKKATIRVAMNWDDEAKDLKDYPKSKRRRTVPLPDWVAVELKPHARKAEGQLFITKAGVPIDYHNWRRRVWEPALKESGIPPTRIHDLRHTYASWLIQDGVPLEEVGRLLGHVSPLTTRRYAHLADTPTEAVLDAIRDPFKEGKRGANVGQSATLQDHNRPDDTGAEIIPFPQKEQFRG
ncbi:tyrosine-type recombinase/integrase [Leucobacter sp. M11]|uniref:tyrosine-type recombinase/integrase n=1 Tax=Leucobacter sp. M11 TaxID=2993565 RepID=UPI002D7ED833|nr:site-specific integrase [Leucobacter sp. M11]MEB4614043.1 site-specific integrase [Leucobacter sp. M11]